ncbi:MAG TPA: hypothetical protein VM802_06120 [Chitinophaga sp.]|uniref:hypothetical protein n=1 Tax=Chitinophaga sp. TaxID=1869181 RepID=UPI002BC66937|nr:hypothetical protein [Chitinophaga sp.]HVI44422.1 hypothetical protein [Chitinophaga sp.]
MAGKPPRPDSTISGVITTNLALGNTKNYLLSGLVYVSNNATLTIAEGGWIGGIKSANFAVPGGGLIITAGAKINAVGTVSNPIVFSSNESNPTSGDWAGIVIIGRAPTNLFTSVQVEGIPSGAPVNVSYGGVQNKVVNDSSGALKYVRIEYAGYELSLDNEINGLTLAGVGNGTILDYIEVYKAKDDAFEFFGGTVNAYHLIAVDPLDDMFDTDKGYTGTITYALGLADTSRADKSGSKGIESDNGSNADTPYTKPTYNFVTIIGLPSAAAASITNGLPSGVGTYVAAAQIRNGARFTITNSIFMGYNRGIALHSTGTSSGTYGLYFSGISILNKNYTHAYLSPYLYYPPETGFQAQGNMGFVGNNPNATIMLTNPFSRLSFSNFVPGPISPARAAGAFPIGNTTWANGWAIL